MQIDYDSFRGFLCLLALTSSPPGRCHARELADLILRPCQACSATSWPLRFSLIRYHFASLPITRSMNPHHRTHRIHHRPHLINRTGEDTWLRAAACAVQSIRSSRQPRLRAFNVLSTSGSCRQQTERNKNSAASRDLGGDGGSCLFHRGLLHRGRDMRYNT